jgi:hypothetical protein
MDVFLIIVRFIDDAKLWMILFFDRRKSNSLWGEI